MNRTPRAMGRHGAMPAGAPMGMKTNPMKTIKRLLKYMTAYKVRLIFVLVCIVFSAGAGVASSLFIQILIDNYITPLMVANEKDFGGLLMAIIIMAVLLTFGALATLLYNRLMVTISQGVQKKIRDEMFSHVFSESLMPEKSHDFSANHEKMKALLEHILWHIKDHEDCFFVFGNGQRGRAVYYADPVSVPEPNFQQNALGFGSWGTKSPYLNDKLGKYGMNNTFGDLIDNDKAFVFENKKKDALTKYLNKWYSDENSEIVLEQVDVIDGHPLWRVRKY